MPPAIDASIKTIVIQQWLAGDSRAKIAIDNNVGEGTVSSIVNNFKIGLDNSEFDSARELVLELKKHRVRLNDLALHFRLYKCFIKSGASEHQVDSFIANVGTADVPPGKIIELVNQLYHISKAESIPIDQVPEYIKQKLEEKQKIDEDIKQADTILQSKNVSIEAINEYLKLKEELDKRGISTQDIDKLLNLQIGVEDLIAFKIAINQAVKHYDLSPLTSTLRLIDDIKKYNKIDGLKKELSSLYMQKYTLDQVCFSQNKSIIALINLQSLGITEDRILELNNFLENNGYNARSCVNTK